MWKKRIEAANKQFNEWEAKFKCKQLSRYYEGFQSESSPASINITANQQYVLNLIASTIDIKLAGFLFQKPTFSITPRPGTCLEYNIDDAATSGQLKEDFLNTVTSNPNMDFVEHIKLAALDSFFYFGVIESGVAKDFRNPQFEFPELKSHTDDEIDKGEKEDKVEKQEILPINDWAYVKRIKPETFRVSGDKKSFLNDHHWVGYYEFYPEASLKKLKGIVWPDDYMASSANDFDGNEVNNPDGDNFEGACKVWHIWDLVTKKRFLFLDSALDGDPLWEGDFEALPLNTLRWKLRRHGWLPKPATFDWLSPQDEINEARVQERDARRKFTNKFQAVEDMVDPEEIEKFTSGGDGTVVIVKQANAITPIMNAEISISSQNALKVGMNDFNIISGTSADARGVAGNETATQSKLIDTRSQIRESFDQMQFEVFVSQVGSTLLTVAINELDSEMWAKVTIPESNDFFTEFQQNKDLYDKVHAYKFKDGYDFTIVCTTQNDTPQAQAQKKQSFLSFITIVQQYPVLASNPILIREAAESVGYRNEKVIGQMQKAAILAVQAQMNQQQQQSGMAQQGNNANNTQMAQMGTPDNKQIENQLAEQVK